MIRVAAPRTAVAAANTFGSDVWLVWGSALSVIASGRKPAFTLLPDGHDERIRAQREGFIRGNGAGTPAVGIGDQPHPAAAQAGNTASIGKDFLRGTQFHDAHAFVQSGFDFFDVSGHFLAGAAVGDGHAPFSPTRRLAARAQSIAEFPAPMTTAWEPMPVGSHRRTAERNES